MGVIELEALKAKYEKELIIAEAKIEVVNDLLEMARNAEQSSICDETVSTEAIDYNETEQSY